MLHLKFETTEKLDQYFFFEDLTSKVIKIEISEFYKKYKNIKS